MTVLGLDEALGRVPRLSQRVVPSVRREHVPCGTIQRVKWPAGPDQAAPRLGEVVQLERALAGKNSSVA
jgi:hypothetical protein